MSDCHGCDHTDVERSVPCETNRESEHICYSLDGAENLGSVYVSVSRIDWSQSVGRWWWCARRHRLDRAIG